MAEENEDVAQPSSNSAKTVLIAILVLDVLCLGGWIWLSSFKLPAKEQEVKRARRDLAAMSQEADLLQTKIARITEGNLDRVRDDEALQAIIRNVAERTPLKSSTRKTLYNIIRVRGGNSRVWRENPRYMQHVVTLTNTEEYGFPFEGIVDFARRLEARNPNIKVIEVNFGERDEAPGQDTWRPKGNFMKVQALTLKQENES